MSRGVQKSYDNIISPSSRYRASSKIVKYNNKTMFDTPYRVYSVGSDKDKFVVVNSTNENRLDLISNSNYGTPKYWWVIADVNNLVNPFEVPIGTVLRLPAMSDIIMSGVIT